MLLELASAHSRESAAGATKVRQRDNLIVDTATPGRAQGASLVGGHSTQAGVGSSRWHSMNRVEARSPAKRVQRAVYNNYDGHMIDHMACHMTAWIYSVYNSLSAFGRFLWRENSQCLVALLFPIKKQVLLLHSEHLKESNNTRGGVLSHTRIAMPYSVHRTQIKGILKTGQVCDTKGSCRHTTFTREARKPKKVMLVVSERKGVYWNAQAVYDLDI